MRRRQVIVGVAGLAFLAGVIVALFLARHRPTAAPLTWHTRTGRPVLVPLIDADGGFKQVHAIEADGYSIAAGDMIVASAATPDPRVSGTGGMALGSGAQSVVLRWTNARIPYLIDGSIPGSDERRRWITAAVMQWNFPRTPIHLVSPPDASDKNVVVFRDAPASNICEAWVGMRAGPGASRQDIFIGAGCGIRQIAHEIGHTIGLDHEHNRHNRDQFISVIWPNILNDRAARDAFTPEAAAVGKTDDLGPYDFKSVMHYNQWEFSQRPGDLPTITVNANIPGAAELSNQIGLGQTVSAGDLSAVKALYPQQLMTPSEELKVLQGQP
jgi:hypothetical protein